MIIPQRAREILCDDSFSGNIRGLLNIVQRIAIFIDDAADLEEILTDLLVPIDVPAKQDTEADITTATLDLRSEVKRFERALIDKAIRIHGSKRKAVKALGVDIGTVVSKTAEVPNEGAAQPSSKRGRVHDD
ncbi:hypothetical protein [Breoghania sp.]|uniref:hypothetical protein n=1 Tax=Breoghania sp. TaxID=2065378 RepID=UPI002639137D|nr:hypothetical protein [Breoghania sp.]MDJ0933394.1 hypothetical protein [Breoghania sp.]